MNAAWRWGTPPTVNRSVDMKWRLPSRACPKMTASAYACRANSSVRAAHVSTSADTGTAMSSSSAVVPARSGARDRGVQACTSTTALPGPPGWTSARPPPLPRASHHRRRLRHPCRQRIRVRLLPLHQERRVTVHAQRPQGRGRPRIRLGHTQRRRIQQLDRGRTRVDQPGQCRHRVREPRQRHKPGWPPGAPLAPSAAPRAPRTPASPRCPRAAARICAGSSSSRKALRPSPIVFLRLNCRRTSADQCQVRPFVPDRQQTSVERRLLRSESGVRGRRPVSSTVPEARTTSRDSSVWYMFRSVPQVMPLELLAMTPPSVQAVSLAGSGPSRRPNGASRAFTARSVTQARPSRAHRHRGSLPRPERAARVHQHGIGHRLAAQAGAARAGT